MQRNRSPGGVSVPCRERRQGAAARGFAARAGLRWLAAACAILGACVHEDRDSTSSPAGPLIVEPIPVTLYAQVGDTGTVSAELTLRLQGTTDSSWSATSADSWLEVSPDSGNLPGGGSVSVELAAVVDGLSAGVYLTSVTFSTPSGDTVVKVALAVRPSARGGYLLYYLSRIDDSLQPYGLYLPASYTRGTPAPLVVKLHGYDGHASDSFASSVTTRADVRGWIVVNLEGRGNHFYDGPAETDLFEVIEDVDRSYGIDRTRVFIEGLSMGATGAYRHIARHPGVFAGAAGSDGWTDFREWHRHWYAPAGSPNEFHAARESNLEHSSPLTHAENILEGRLYIGTDGSDTIVLPENGVKLHERLQRLSTAHAYVFNASGGHCATYDQAAMHDFFAGLAPLDADPANIRLRSNRLRTCARAWLRVERFAWDGFADIEASRSLDSGTCTYTVLARNVERFTITSAPAASRYVVVANGVVCADFASGERSFPLTLELTLDGTGEVVAGGVFSGAPATLQKTPALEGPIARAVSDRFLVAWGSSDSRYEEKNRAEAEEFCKYWEDVWNSGRFGFNASISPVDEDALSAAMLASANLVIFGSEESSDLLARMCGDRTLPFNLPVRLAEDAITFADEPPLSGTQYGIWMVYPNPLAPTRLVVVGHNVIGETPGLQGAIFWTQEGWSWMWPDYVIIDTSSSTRSEVDGGYYVADQYVLAGSFDRDWLPPLAGSPRTEVAVSVAPASYAKASGPALLSVTVTDGVTPVAGLPEGSFDFRLDGESRAATLVGESGGVYSWQLPIADLEIGTLSSVGFDVTVEVARPVGGRPVVGRGRARFTITQ